MKKQVKVLSAAALAAAAIVPAAVQVEAAEATNNLDAIVVKNPSNGQLYTMTYSTFEALFIDGFTDFDIQYVIIDGNNYHIDDYNEAFIDTEDAEATISTLAESGDKKEVEVSGELVYEGTAPEFKDETPEENIIETFFYNLAA